MPSHHHHHHHHQQSCCCCCCSSDSSSPSPLPPTYDQLLQALTTQLLLQSQTPQHHLYTQHYQPPQRTHQPKDHQQTHSLLHSLLRRVSALESSLSHLSSSSPPPPPPRHQEPPKPFRPPRSLKDLAARTIQSHFRLFLVRRSQTLRHLKHLASIKSHVASLRSSLSDKTPPQALSHKAMDLLLQLDSIQSGDPMIREGKRSISRELVRISEFVDKVLVKEHAENGCDEVLYTKSAKRVSFAENGQEPRVSATDSPKRISEIGGFLRVFEEDEEQTPLRNQGFYQLSDGEESPKASGEEGVRYGIGKGFQGQNGNLGLSAPLPVQMEPRRRW